MKTRLSALFRLALVVCVCAILFLPVSAFATPEYAAVSGMPNIGKWMLQSDGVTVANWLGATINGKTIQEPINVIIIDGFATSSENAIARLMSKTDTAGYKSRTGHSSGYKGYLGNAVYNQQPSEDNHAFSTTFFWLNNNHGRTFGPYLYNGKYYFIGAFSREVIAVSNPIHKYDSFITARNDFATKMASKAGYVQRASVSLQNAIPSTHATLTSGDHDGMAVVLETTN